MLPYRSLPRNVLPCRAVKIIREYSRPMTRPDWRKSKPPITIFRLYLLIKYIMYTPIISPTKRLHSMILYNICETDWYYVYVYIKFYGLRTYLHEHKDYTMLKADGIQDAIYHYRYA